MKAVNPLVQLGIQVRRGVRQVMRVGSSLARLMLLEGISYHREKAFISHRASSPHLPLDRTEQKATGFLAESLCSKAQPGDRGEATPARSSPAVAARGWGRSQQRCKRSSAWGSRSQVPSQTHCYSTFFFPLQVSKSSIILQVDIVSCVILRRNT